MEGRASRLGEACENFDDQSPGSPSEDRKSSTFDRSEDLDKVQVVSVDKVTVEKIVLETARGSREVLLTKNETSKRLSLKSQRESNVKRAVASDKDSLSPRNSGVQSRLPISKGRKAGGTCKAEKIKPIKLTKASSIGSLGFTKGACKTSLFSKRKPAPNKQLRQQQETKELDLGSAAEPLVRVTTKEEAESVENQRTKEKEAKEAKEGSRGKIDAQNLLEQSQSKIEDLQQNLTTKIHADTARTYKERLLGVGRVSRIPISGPGEAACPSPSLSEVLVDQEFLKKRNLDKRLSIEEVEKRPTESDVDYASDVEKTAGVGGVEAVGRRGGIVRPRYSKKVSELEKRWSGDFLESRLHRNSSESSKSSYVEELGSVSSAESVEDREDARSSLDRRSSEVQEVDARTGKRGKTLDEVLEASTISTIDSDSCLEDKIKTAEEDIAEDTDDQVATESSTRDQDNSAKEDARESRDRVSSGTRREPEKPSEVSQVLSIVEASFKDTPGPGYINEARRQGGGALYRGTEAGSTKEADNLKVGSVLRGKSKSCSSDSETLFVRGARKDGYANLIKEFTMEAGTSRVKKEEKQKRKLGFRRLLPGFFSPKDSRKEYSKKEQKERKKHDERHFARYQKNGNYTRSPDTLNLNDDITRNVQLNTSLNGSVIEERLDEIKRELFPEQGLVTSTPDHFAQVGDHQAYLQDRPMMGGVGGGGRSYNIDSSLSSIAPDERWLDRNPRSSSGMPVVRKYDQNRLPSRASRDPQDQRRYGQLERKHSLQEQNPNVKNMFFVRNHASSGRVSAPPNERFVLRPRAIHPVDRPLPAIPHSRTDLSNYENYHDDTSFTSGAYESDQDRSVNIPNALLSTVPGQMKLTRQPVVAQNQRAPLIGKSSTKYPSPGSSRRSGDYADSSCTPNSSQKSEFSPNSSKSGEYYLSSPRNSSRASTNDRENENENESENVLAEDFYECQEQQRNLRSPERYDDRIYDATPSENGDYSMSSKLLGSQNRSVTSENPSRPLDNSFDRKEVREVSKDNMDSSVNSVLSNSSAKDYNSMASPSPRQAKSLVLTTASPVGSLRSTTSRRSQPSDQILIASPKRDATHGNRERCVPPQSSQGRPISPLPTSTGPDRAYCKSPVDIKVEPYDKSGSPSKTDSPMRSPRSPINLPAICNSSTDIQRPEPIYSHRKLQAQRLDSPSPIARRDCRSPVNSNLQAAAIPAQNPGDRSNASPALSSPARIGSPMREITNLPSAKFQQVQQVNVMQQQQQQLQQQQQQQQQRVVSPIPNRFNSSQETIYGHRNPPQQETTYEQQQQQQKHPQQQQVGQEAIYVKKEAVYGQQSKGLVPPPPPSVPAATAAFRRQDLVYGQRSVESSQGQYSPNSCPMSPSKKQTMQHLEAFYWQQKALEARRNSPVPPAVNINANQPRMKVDSPEIREAVYWQQLKKLDEEQQRRLYEENLFGERSRNWKVEGKVQINSMNAANVLVERTEGTTSWSGRKLAGGKVQPMGKPPLMQGQKGQNQPVLIVRPQQAIRERHDLQVKGLLEQRDQQSQDVPRSKSASPHFQRVDGDWVVYGTSRKPMGECIIGAGQMPRRPENAVLEEEAADPESKPGPTPIFKRGSLIGSDIADYGSTGPKRVSFSSQSNPGHQMAAGKWPTKYGTAPEPPTRRHRSEDAASSDTDSVFSREYQDSVYGNLPTTCRTFGEPRRNDGSSLDSEYDANKPLPPPPKDLSWNNPRAPPSRKWPSRTGEPGGDVIAPDNPSFRQRREEEWNPDGKGRQSNDTGGSGRVEGDLGSNELTPGRRGGGGGGIGGGSVSGGVLGVGGAGGRAGGGIGGRSRDEPRRHTLGGDHQPSLHHQQFNAAQQLHPLHPHHLPPPHGQYGTPPMRHTTMDLEMGTKSRQRKSPLPRGYPPPSSAMLFDDDPGIMSEVETSSTGFRRGNKQRSSLPVVRTPSKTLERPLGLVFLQYRNETKRALLPNEITSIDTVKALFVRSFPKQLTMEYLDSPHVKVYIHDSNKDMFYELEDLRSHLRDIRDRSVLRLFESTDGVTGMPGPLGVPGSGAGIPPHWEDQSYFSEPEFDSEYQHQHIHKSKTAKNSSGSYYVGGSSTLPRGGSLLRAYSPAASSIISGPNATPSTPKSLTAPGGGGVPPAKPLRSYQCGKSPLGSLGGSARFSRDSSVSLYSIPDRLHGESGYMSSPERGGGVGSASGRYPPGPYSAGSSYEDPYYSQYSGTVTPVIDEEASDTELLEESYSLYGVKPPSRPPSGPPRSPFSPGGPASLPPGGPSYDVTRIRVEHMERQLANLTGLVQKALTHAPHTSPSPRDYLQVPAGRDPYARAAGAGDEFDKHSSSSSASLPDDSYLRTDVKPPKLGKDKSVSFEKSVSFSDEPPDMNSPKQHSPQHAADTKPTKPAIKSSTLPRMSSQERDSRHKPTPPPKPAALVAGQYVYRDLALTPEMYNQLRGLQKKAKDLRQEVRNLRRMSQAQAHTVRETIRDTFITIRAMLLSGGDAAWTAGDAEKIRLSREEDLYKQEMIRLEKDLTELESTVEELRGNVINRKTRVNMSDVENMALILSKSSKTVADLKVRFPNLQEGMKGLLSSEMEKVVREEKFLKEEPERLESALRRCKKLTGTLVTLKRLASVQEQRLPNSASVDAEETPPITPTSAQHSKAAAPVPAERTVVGSASVLGGGPHVVESSAAHQQRPENALDALLDELQTFSRPSSQLGHSSLGSSAALAEIGRTGSREVPAASATPAATTRPPSISDIGRKGSVDSSCGPLPSEISALPGLAPGSSGTLRRLHSYPSSSDTDTSPPIARLQVSLQDPPGGTILPAGFPGQKPPVPERKAELLQLASAKRVPPPPPPRTSSRSPLASPTSPQLPPRSHPCNLQTNNATTLRRPAARGLVPGKEGKPPMALPPEAASVSTEINNGGGPPPVAAVPHNSSSSQSSAVLSTSNSSSCESVNSQEGMQSKRSRQELDQRHQELLRQQKALQEQFARLQQLQRNTAGRTTVPPAPPDLKKTGSESNLLAKTGFIGLSAVSSGSWASLNLKTAVSVDNSNIPNSAADVANGQPTPTATSAAAPTTANQVDATSTAASVSTTTSLVSVNAGTTTTTATTTTTSKIYETDIL